MIAPRFQTPNGLILTQKAVLTNMSVNREEEVAGIEEGDVRLSD
jgi:hypothetical protein